MNVYLYLSGAVAIGSAFGHSYLGETRLIGPLLSSTERASVLKSATSRRILRAVWHLPSVFWTLMGLMTIALARQKDTTTTPLFFALAGYLLSGMANFIATRGRHIGWPLLLATSGLLWAGISF